MLSAKLLVAFDAASVCGARLPWSLGTPRVQSLVRIPLSSGSLAPSPFEENLIDPAAVAGALREVRQRLQGGARACLILPDGVARTLLIEVPPRVEPMAFARFRLTPALPYPAGEAVVDVLRVGRGRYVAAAVRRSVVRGYEAAAADAGFVQERVDLAPLAALAGLLRRGRQGASVDVILGDAALSLAAFADDGTLRFFRSRRRDPGPDESDRLRDEVERTAALGGLAPAPRVRVVGPGAPALIRDLSFGGCPAEAAWKAQRDGLSLDAAELAWFGAALA